MMYQIGDRVQIRKDLKVGEDYGLHPIRMLHDMRTLRGTTGVVTDTMPEELAVKVGDWWWSEVMVVPAVGQDSDTEAEQTQKALLAKIIGDFRGFDPSKSLDEQLAEHLYANNVRVWVPGKEAKA